MNAAQKNDARPNMEYGETMFADMTKDELQSFVSSSGSSTPVVNKPHTVITSASIREKMAKDKKRADVKIIIINKSFSHNYCIIIIIDTQRI